MICVSIRAILHDPATYPEPEQFKPERFLTPDGQPIEDPLLDYAFGFGARYAIFIWVYTRYLINPQKVPWPLPGRGDNVALRRVALSRV
jgi:hypothetical protein